MSEQGTTKDQVCKFKRGDIVRWNALALHGMERDGWAVQGLETKNSLLPIYRLRRGKDTGSAVETDLEALPDSQVCPEHVTDWAVGCPSCGWAQDAKRQREQRPSKDLTIDRELELLRKLEALVIEREQLRTALRGIQSCSTCGACRGAAALALGGAAPACIHPWDRVGISGEGKPFCAQCCTNLVKDPPWVTAPEPGEALSVAMKEAGSKVFGGQWIDHAADCKLGIDDEKCSCGLSDWLRRNESYLGIHLGGSAQPPEVEHEKSYCMSPEDITENAQPDDETSPRPPRGGQ